MDDFKLSELKRLNFEDMLWIIFIFLSFCNIVGNHFEKKYLHSNAFQDKHMANEVFLFALTVTFFIYIYFFIRNYHSFKNSSPKERFTYTIKVLGSIFLIIGVLCLIYFQKHNEDFIGSPGL